LYYYNLKKKKNRFVLLNIDLYNYISTISTQKRIMINAFSICIILELFRHFGIFCFFFNNCITCLLWIWYRHKIIVQTTDYIPFHLICTCPPRLSCQSLKIYPAGCFSSSISCNSILVVDRIQDHAGIIDVS
jgi:hypothetical protein